MNKDRGTFGLKPDKLSSILRIMSDNNDDKDADTADQRKIELLYDRLAEVLPSHTAGSKPLTEELTELCNMSGLATEDTIKRLLYDLETSVSKIREIKNYSKTISQKAKDEVGHDTANAIYFAAIASALIFRSHKISKYSYSGLKESFLRFSKLPWVPSDLSKLFIKASKYCDRKIREEA